MSWSEILGQDLAKRTLSAHLAAGTTAGAYLFAGPEGVGKRRLALELAEALNCTSDGSRPCDTCLTCQHIAKGNHPDVHRVAPGGASNQIKMDDIRHVLERIALRPYSARVQVAILEGAHRLTEEAANSLLKSLEEPTATTCFVLTTEQLSDCLLTIVSRCQVIRCHPLPSEAVQQAYERLLNQLADPEPGRWIQMPLPESRQDVAQLLDVMTVRLKDLAAAAAGDASRYGEADRYVETAFELAVLRESLEQFVSPKLVAALAREHWLNLMSVQCVTRNA